MNVLFLNVGRRCELVEAFRRALLVRGGGRIYGSDVTDRAPGLYKVDEARVLPHGSHPDFVDALMRLCTEGDIGLVIPTIDPDLEFLTRHRDALAARCPSTRLLLPPPAVIEIARDKRRTRDRFAALGAEVPVAVDPDDPALAFPIFMKPARGRASEGIHLVRDGDELTVYRRQTPDAMFERVVEGPEYTVDVLCDFDGRALCAVPRKRLKVRAGEVVHGIVERHAALETLAMRLAEGFGCTGPVTLQFRAPAPSRFVAMELNARMGGGLPLAIAAGADWPGWILDLTAGKAPNLDVPIRDGLVVLRYDASVFVETKTPPPTPRAALGKVKAVIFDLDDTLYPERDFVYGGYRAVAERVFKDHGVDLEPTLRAQFERGLRQDVFGQALRAHDVPAPRTTYGRWSRSIGITRRRSALTSASPSSPGSALPATRSGWSPTASPACSGARWRASASPSSSRASCTRTSSAAATRGSRRRSPIGAAWKTSASSPPRRSTSPTIPPRTSRRARRRHPHRPYPPSRRRARPRRAASAADAPDYDLRSLAELAELMELPS